MLARASGLRVTFPSNSCQSEASPDQTLRLDPAESSRPRLQTIPSDGNSQPKLLRTAFNNTTNSPIRAALLCCAVLRCA